MWLRLIHCFYAACGCHLPSWRLISGSSQIAVFSLGSWVSACETADRLECIYVPRAMRGIKST